MSYIGAVVISRRTANRLLNSAKRYDDLADRFAIVGSHGREQTLRQIANTVREMGIDLHNELVNRGKRRL